MPATLEEKEKYIQYRQMGASQMEATRKIGRSKSWAHRFETSGQIPVDLKATFPGQKASHRKAELARRPVAAKDLSDDAVRALSDFEFFRRRYFGHVSTPWQVEAAETLRGLLESDSDDFVVVNCPPGGGKTTLFTSDIPAWLIARDRTVRCLLGHRVQSMANLYSGRLRAMFSRRTPVQAKERQRRMGLECDAAATLSGDFGPFKPAGSEELWRREAFTVVQPDELRSDEKESTVVAFGMDSGQLGYRADFIVWDDLVSTKIRTTEAVANQRDWFDDEAETRLEPGGVFVLVGQRLAANDLYRYCLDKRAVTEVDLADIDGGSSGAPIYHHIVYRAHDEGRCEELGDTTSKHDSKTADPWPDGCLLDPLRLSHAKLQKVRNDERKYRVLYQQEDVDPAAVLVPKLWVDGGRDPGTGEEFVGCWDKDRRVAELPEGLRPPLVSVATADPSPTKFWAIEWLVWQPSTGMVFLMDLERRAMDAPDFLDWNEQTRTFSGVMQEWQRRSRDLGVPITSWVVEQNAAQRFILQYDHFRRWQQHWGVRVFGHETSRNKADAELGLEASIKPLFRRGLIRLPGSQDGVTRMTSMKLVDEATRYPDVSTDDTLMALWFFLFSMGKGRFNVTDPGRMPRAPTPSFVKEAA